jgi:hypothetical protein
MSMDVGVGWYDRKRSSTPSPETGGQPGSPTLELTDKQVAAKSVAWTVIDMREAGLAPDGTARGSQPNRPA